MGIMAGVVGVQLSELTVGTHDSAPVTGFQAASRCTSSCWGLGYQHSLSFRASSGGVHHSAHDSQGCCLIISDCVDLLCACMHGTVW